MPSTTHINCTVRDEQPGDIAAIDRVTQAAFLPVAYSSHTEQFIVSALRAAGQLTMSLVAETDGHVVGHVAVSPVSLSSGDNGWYGLGPISVRPDHQNRAVGTSLMQAAIHRLKAQGSAGCVLLGDPAYYARFGFKAYPDLVLPGVPGMYFQALPFTDHVPKAQVRYHPAFEATA